MVGGHTISQKKNKKSEDVLTITADKPVKKYKVGKYPCGQAQTGWPWIDGTPGVPKKGWCWCWTVTQKNGIWEPDTFDLVVVKDLSIESEDFFIQKKEEKQSRAAKAARRQEAQEDPPPDPNAANAADAANAESSRGEGGEDIE